MAKKAFRGQGLEEAWHGGQGGRGLLPCPLRLTAQYLVLFAGWSRWFNQLLQDPQAHEGNVLNNHRSLNVHRHEEKTES